MTEKAGSIEENLKKALSEMLVLKLFSDEERYIGELPSLLEKQSGGRLSITSLYAAVYRLLGNGSIESVGQRISSDGRRRQFYGITEEGSTRFTAQKQVYEEFIKGVNSVLRKGSRKKAEV